MTIRLTVKPRCWKTPGIYDRQMKVKEQYRLR
jgi:hypothetical protein